MSPITHGRPLMRWFRKPSNAPLWQDEFPVFTADERYVSRRQFTKFLTLTSFGMFAGNVWILVRSLFSRTPTYPQLPVASVDEVPVGGVKTFAYPTPSDPYILIRTAADMWVAFSQKCTHLSCAVIPRPEEKSFFCPCHEGRFDLETGAPTAGPPRRPLTRIALGFRGRDIYAVGVEERTT